MQVMRKALRILHDEHLTLAGLLRAILAVLAESRERGTPPDFALLRAMLFYIAEFPEKRHHHHESDLLFPKLRALSPRTRGLLDRLDEEHRRGDARIRELEHALTAFELLGVSHRDVFEEAARRYVDFHLAHIVVEEREVLPLAEQTLGAEDWDEIEEAMARDPDPLGGSGPDPDYRRLFATITFAAIPGSTLIDAQLPAVHE
jgi:hemerythrin-like domain-containing protein